MKRVVIGLSVMFSGLMIVMGIIISGETHASNLISSLELRWLFGTGKWLFIIGLFILLIEYFKENKAFKGFFKEEKRKDINEK
jgi:hypothetical protein